MSPLERAAYFNNTREYQRWFHGWKRNAVYASGPNKGKPLSRSMIRRVGSRARALELGLIKK